MHVPQLPMPLPRAITPRSPERRTFGPAWGKLARALGTPLMPWQQLVADVAGEVLDDGSWAYRTVVVTVQRQAGKTTLVGPVHLHGAMTYPRPSYITAQKRSDARDTWLDVAQRLRDSPLSKLAKIRESNGDEGIWFGRGSFRPFAPTEDGLHGKANGRVTVDEGWAFDLAQGAALEQAILPTFTTTGGQLWMVSTAGHGGSHWLRNYVERGRAAVGADRREGICYAEWSIDAPTATAVAAGLGPGATAIERAAAFDLLLRFHPSAGITLDRKALETAAEMMTVDQFLRAYGNWWTSTVDRVIPEHVWAAIKLDGWPKPEPGQLALAFDVALDRSSSSIAAVWRPAPAAPLRVDIIDTHPGTAWLADRLRELHTTWRPSAVGYDRSGPAVAVADDLARGGMTLQPTTAGEYAAACQAFLSGVESGGVEHRGQAVLDDAVAAAATRPLGDGGWAWGRRTSTGSIAPLVAATVGAWVYDHRPAPPAAPMIVARRHRVGAAA